MKANASNLQRLLVVTVFSIAFAWVESAIVFYLRMLVDRSQPFQANPLPLVEGLVGVEIVREAATMIILATVGILAGHNRASRLGYGLVAFGIWDIFYYLLLVPMTGWPHSVLDWDVLFLIPLPWWGPVLAPTLIAVLMITWGILVTQFEARPSQAFKGRWIKVAFGGGVVLALYTFMADAIRVAPQGETALREMLPTRFNWPLFLVAFALMALPVVRLAGERCRLRRTEPSPEAAFCR